MALDPLRLGFAGGILWSIGLLTLSLLGLTGYAATWIALLKEAYLGYTLTLGGIIIGMFYAFLDGFVGLWLLAWLYNKMGKETSQDARRSQ